MAAVSQLSSTTRDLPDNSTNIGRSTEDKTINVPSSWEYAKLTSIPPARSTKRRAHSPPDSSANSDHSEATYAPRKRRLVDSFTRLSIDPTTGTTSSAYTPSPPAKKKQESILHYDYWDMSKPACTAEEQQDDLANRMDTGDSHTVFVGPLDSSTDEELDIDNCDAPIGQRLIFAPSVDRKLISIPYSFLQRHDYSSVPTPIALKEQETGLVLYKPKEQVIAESIARQPSEDQKFGRRKARARHLSANDFDEDNWGDDEREDSDAEISTGNIDDSMKALTQAQMPLQSADSNAMDID
ncbi:uncharacterized protein V1516DRAFT_646943 [Lipomyces oligophaga]|uniref:uncharacterized protein n=1 Tax=Lipomyces oligophaga TaxID=45792 RepID=UPI0034CD9EE3